MFFIYSVICYILGLAIFYSCLFSYPLFFLLLGFTALCLLNLLALFIYKNHIVFQYLLLLGFGIFGILVGIFHNFFNNTLILQESLTGVYAYGEIYKIEESPYNNKNYLHIKNLVFNIKDINPTTAPNSIKVVYKGKAELHDIIHGNFYLFPPSTGLYPHGFNFYKSAFFKNIGANGFIVGKVDIIDNFWSANFLERISIYLTHIKENIIGDINKYSSSKAAPFLNAIAIGESTFLPMEDVTNLRKTSLAHLIAISGYHISLITAFLFFTIRFLLVLYPRISLNYNIKQLTAFLCIICLLFYAFLVGDHAPALRAILMGLAALLGIILQFNVISLNSLFLAIFLILVVKPFYVYSASFLLSSVAAFGVITLWHNKYMQNLYNFSQKNFGYRMVFFILACMATSVFVEILIAPILAFYFQEIPLIGIVTNLVAEPIFAFIIMPSLIAYTFLPIIIGKYFIMIASFGMLIILKIAATFANLPHATWYTPFVPSNIMYGYLLLLLLMLILQGYYKCIPLAIMALLGMFYYFTPCPIILIDDSLSLVAFKDHKQYVLSNTTSKFTANIWFKDKRVINNKTIYNHESFKCFAEHCVWQNNHKIITFATNNMYYMEDCGIADVIILTTVKPFTCTYGITLDKKYIAQHGASFIYIKPDKIKITSNN